jgi:hypothetical protein
METLLEAVQKENLELKGRFDKLESAMSEIEKVKRRIGLS